MTPKCCYIIDQDNPNPENRVSCPRAAEWEIHFAHDAMRPTEACTEHVGVLLSDDSEHRIYPIAERPHES